MNNKPTDFELRELQAEMDAELELIQHEIDADAWSDFQRYDHLSIAEACLAAERDERVASRAARQSGAVFTNWVITDRD